MRRLISHSPMTFTCLRIMSMVCMVHRGMRPWFLAKIIACSRVTFWVHLQRTKNQKVSPTWTMSLHAIISVRLCEPLFTWRSRSFSINPNINSGGGGARLTYACRCHTWWCDRLPGGYTAQRTHTARWHLMGGPGCSGARWRRTAWVGKGRPVCSEVAAATKRRQSFRVFCSIPLKGHFLYFNKSLLQQNWHWKWEKYLDQILFSC